MDPEAAADRIELKLRRELRTSGPTSHRDLAARLTVIADALRICAEEQAIAAIEARESFAKIGRAYGQSRQTIARRLGKYARTPSRATSRTTTVAMLRSGPSGSGLPL